MAQRIAYEHDLTYDARHAPNRPRSHYAAPFSALVSRRRLRCLSRRRGLVAARKGVVLTWDLRLSLLGDRYLIKKWFLRHLFEPLLPIVSRALYLADTPAPYLENTPALVQFPGRRLCATTLPHTTDPGAHSPDRTRI